MPHKIRSEQNKYQRTRYHNNPEVRRKLKECQKRWYEKNKEKVNAYRRQWVKKNRAVNPDKWKGYELRKKYGLTLIQYREKLVSQDSLCEICRRPETGKHPTWKGSLPLAVDHDHVSGNIRGLLCHACNKRLGVIESNWLEKAVAYLAKYKIQENAT